MSQRIFVLVTILLAALSCKANPTKDSEMPAECSGKYLCHTKSQFYPEDVIEDLLKDSDDLYDLHELVQDRDGETGNTREPCDSDRRMTPIYEIIDENDMLRYVVQSQRKFRQIIRTEECLGTKPDGYHFTDLLIDVHKLECKQKYIDFKFVVLSLNRTNIETVKIKGGVPVCCSCHNPED